MLNGFNLRNTNSYKYVLAFIFLKFSTDFFEEMIKNFLLLCGLLVVQVVWKFQLFGYEIQLFIPIFSSLVVFSKESKNKSSPLFIENWSIYAERAIYSDLFKGMFMAPHYVFLFFWQYMDSPHYLLRLPTNRPSFWYLQTMWSAFNRINWSSQMQQMG